MLCNKEEYASLIEEKLYFYYQRKDSAVHITDLFESIYKKIDCFFYTGNKQINKDRKEHYIGSAIENALGFRYHAKTMRKSDFITKFDAQLVNAIDMMKSNKLFNKKKRFVYSAFSKFPFLYCAVANRNKGNDKRDD